MTDEQMDARLREAGERWRVATTVLEDERGEPIELLPPSPSRPHRMLAMLSAAAVVVALAIGAVLFAVNRGSHAPAASDPTRALQGVTWTAPSAAASLVFRPGGVTVAGNCFVTTHTLRARGHQLALGHVVGPGYLCGGILGTPAMRRAEAAFDRVVQHGPFTWSLSGHALTLSARGSTISLTASSQRPRQLDGQTWRLDTVNGPRGHTYRSGYGATLTFNSDGSFTATDTCGAFSGNEQSNLAAITFSDVSETANGCTQSTPVRPVIDMLLRGTTGYLIMGDQLILSRDGYRGRLFYMAVQSLPHDLTGEAWSLSRIGFGSGEHEQGAKPAIDSTVTFGTRTFTATHRCQDQSGSVSVAGSTMTITDPHVVDGHSCPSMPKRLAHVVNAEERAVDRILNGTVEWSITGDQLTITSPGVGTLVFVRH